MVNYIEASTAPPKNTGAIRLYDAEAFEVCAGHVS